MAMSEEQARWKAMVIELRQTFTLERLAEEIGVSVRQVCNWQSGEDIPRGMNAVKLYSLHERGHQS
jgi:DNA-binding transcriptional regulator YiaG